jgi:hypothetical protein
MDCSQWVEVHMTTRRKPSSVSGSIRGGGADAPPKRNTESEGYDAEQGSAEEGLDPLSLASEEDDDVGTEGGLSLDTEDLGPRMLESATQAARGTTHEATSSSQPPSEPGGLDLTQNVIDEGSLFDQPRAEGGTRHPALRTNEVDATLDRNQRAMRARHRRGTRQQ